VIKESSVAQSANGTLSFTAHVWPISFAITSALFTKLWLTLKTSLSEWLMTRRPTIGLVPYRIPYVFSHLRSFTPITDSDIRFHSLRHSNRRRLRLRVRWWQLDRPADSPSTRIIPDIATGHNDRTEYDVGQVHFGRCRQRIWIQRQLQVNDVRLLINDTQSELRNIFVSTRASVLLYCP
jgi:hypothetical protein